MSLINWQYREKCLEKKPAICHLCDVDGIQIEVHHVDGDYTNDSLENLLPVCIDCHCDIHMKTGRYPDLEDQLLPVGERPQTKLNSTVQIVEQKSRIRALQEAREIINACDEILNDGDCVTPSELQESLLKAEKNISKGEFSKHFKDALAPLAGVAIVKGEDEFADRIEDLLTGIGPNLKQIWQDPLEREADDRGRITLGSQWSEKRVHVAVLGAEDAPE